MSDDVTAIRSKAEAALKAGETLRVTPIEERAAWLHAWATAFGPTKAFGQRARTELPEETGLSAEMVSWGLRSTFDTLSKEALLELHQQAHEAVPVGWEPLSLVSVVLAANVFTAPVRAVALPLLFGTPVLVKPASSQTRFAALLRGAAIEADASLGKAIEIATFRGGDPKMEEAFHAFAEVASVYGSDETVNAVRASLDGRIPVLSHGHGVSAAYCSARSLDPTVIDETASRLALDVAAYDQRGCLSPQVIYVQRSDRTPIDEVAAHLSGALEAISALYPRSDLADDIGAAQMQWRGLAEVEGKLVGGRDHAIAIRSDSNVRWSPGYRNVTMVPVDDHADAVRAMRAFAAHLKCVGADPTSLDSMNRELRGDETSTAYATLLGSMQTPTLDTPVDGRAPWEGLTRRHGAPYVG